VDISLVAAETKDAFFHQLANCIDEKLTNSQAEHVKAFSELFYENPVLDELEGKALNDIYGSAFAWWNFIQQRASDAPKVRVFNPSIEEDGWLCGHTVVAVLQRDMPFLVDSIRIEINRRNIDIHAINSSVLTVARDASGGLLDLVQKGVKFRNTKTKNFQQEALVYLEINLHTDEAAMAELATSLDSLLEDITLSVTDYKPLLEQVGLARTNIQLANSNFLPESVKETDAFLSWLDDGHFTFLGYTEYEFYEADGERHLREVSSKRLGIFRKHPRNDDNIKESNFNPGMARFHLSPQLLSFTKSSVRSRVHRRAYSDYVVVKRFDQQGKVCGECRFLGLYTSPVYTLSPSKIPVIREKVEHVLQRSGLEMMSHDGKSLRQILETFPRDELFQSSESELFETSMGVAQIKERHMVRLFLRRDPYGKFVNGIVYVPRDAFSTQIRQQIQSLIGQAVSAKEDEFTTYFSESLLARAHIVFRIDPNELAEFDVKRLESQIVDITRTWEDRLRECLRESHGEERGQRLFSQFSTAFSSGYRESYEVRSAVQDIDTIASLSDDNNLAMSFYRPMGAGSNTMRFKVFHLHRALELSDIIPLLENLGLRVLGEHPYSFLTSDRRCIWMHDFELRFDLPTEVDVHAVRNNFQEAFEAIWRQESDSDAYNRLVLGARISWREVVVLRAYGSYMKQTAFNSSQTYIARTLANHLDITRNLVALFKASFDPRVNQGTEKDLQRIVRLEGKIIDSLDQVDNLNEDRIVRRYLDFIKGTLRTNFFQRDESGVNKPYVSFKFAPDTIPDIPEPRPMFEIFVYSPRMEGMHLRGGKVARGGLRWSDRQQDYRTEVLGLVKAQQVKNAVIVPNGAKGGFVAKKLPTEGGREAFIKEGIACYQMFIRGLLDITDNIVEGEIVPPKAVVRKDEDDPYLVVAADKGTATFSDIANAISEQYNHWLGDAFASGGSVGYDHKGMGITARGAWVSVQRHFKEQGLNVQESDFTVIGVGDMAGDVFGNGMLMSEHICLTAAFNHLHIFIDPNPDAAKSFVERQRLFTTPGASWADYDESLISKGGAVFSRAAKSIAISAEMKKRFAITANKLTPTELLNALLKAPVDLIWNGGIGTYVKSANETHSDVGDKANDVLRVNGSELRCKVFGEGGNLGMTQLGRIEFCLSGGACNTDFIDNAAGVDCSDHEVNIKILLDGCVSNGDMTQKQRNKQLEDMTDTVSSMVLSNNYKQTQAISLAEHQVATRVGEYRRFMNSMVESGRLDRGLEFLPEDDAIVERQQQGKSLTRPELSVLISYSKVMLKEALNEDALTDDVYMVSAVENAFPAQLQVKYKTEIYSHRLRKQIVATQIANDMVNHMGITFCHRLTESTGSSEVDVAKAYVTARDVYSLPSFFARVEALDYRVDAVLQHRLQLKTMRRMRRATRWFLRNRRGHLSPQVEVESLAPQVQALMKKLPEEMCGAPKDDWQTEFDELVGLGIPKALAAEAALPATLYSALSIVEAARLTGAKPERMAQVYFSLGDLLGLHWFSSQVSEVKVENFWQAMAREAFMDDVDSQMRTLAIAIIRLQQKGQTVVETIERWMAQHELLVGRWRSMITELQGAAGTDFAMFSVALRELLDLAQASQHCTSLEDGSSECTGE